MAGRRISKFFCDVILKSTEKRFTFYCERPDKTKLIKELDAPNSSSKIDSPGHRVTTDKLKNEK